MTQEVRKVQFILQKEPVQDIDVLIVKQELDKQRLVHSYTEMSLKKLEGYLEKEDGSMSEKLKEAVPVGTLEFVSCYLEKVHGIRSMNPIEVPECLRLGNILKRDYSIIERKDIPEKGYYFLKNVSRLKRFSYTGELGHIFNDGTVLEDGLYQLSEVVGIESEFRVFVHRDRIVNVVNYDGKPYIFPDKMLLLEMVMRYSLDQSRPASYTMDVAVVKNRGTALLEIHPWTSVGLYGYMFGAELPYCYRDGLDYYIRQNKPVQPWKR